MKQEHLRKGNRTIREGKGAEDQGMRGGPGGHEGWPAPLKVASWGTVYIFLRLCTYSSDNVQITPQILYNTTAGIQSKNSVSERTVLYLYKIV